MKPYNLPLKSHGQTSSDGSQAGSVEQSIAAAACADTRPRVSILWLHEPPDPGLLPSCAVLHTSRTARPDVIVLRDANALNLLTGWVSKATAAVVPIINCSGQPMICADQSLAIPSPETLALALTSLQAVRDRVRLLPEAYFSSSDPSHWLLARLATRDRGADALRDPSTPSTFRYADQCLVPDFLACAERLSRTGYLERHFFDRLNTCPACSGARLLIREECRNCRSSHVSEEPIIHHLRCAYQGPERDFREGEHLVCPKCRTRLEHFSVDYDKPGTLTVCSACGHATGEPAVGYFCIDCNSKGDASLLNARIVHSYTLTERGRESVFSQTSPLGEGANIDAPRLRQAVREFVAEHRALGLPCTILVIRLDPQRAAAAGATAEAFAAAADFFGEMLRETFTPDTEILRNELTFSVLISGDTPDSTKADLPRIRDLLERNLGVDVAASYDVMALDDFMPAA